MTSTVDLTSSPRSARPTRNLSVSWSHIAAAAAPSSPLPDSTPIEQSLQKSPPDSQSPPLSESPDHAINGNATPTASKSKKPVWNVPSNCSSEAGAVMNAAHWPALSESARACTKSSSSDSLKGLSDGASSVHLGSLSPSPKPASNMSSPSLTPNPLSSARHKSTKPVATNTVDDGSSSGGKAPNGGLDTSSSFPSLSRISQSVPDKQSSPKGFNNNNDNNTNGNNNGINNSSSSNHWDNSSRPAGVSQQSHGGNDHHRGFGGGRRGNNGQHNSYGNRRDPERGGYEWNHRNFVRDVHVQQLQPQWGAGPYSRPPPVAAHLIAPPPPPRPFNHSMSFPDMSSAIYYVPLSPHPDPLRGFSFAPPPAPPPRPPLMFLPAPDPQRALLLKQIDYYFSPENLCKDTYLRTCMDEQGWVPVSVIAGFNRVKQLTNSIPYITDTLRFSSVVETQGDRIRRRNDWSLWVLNAVGSAQPVYDAVAIQFPNMGLGNAAAAHHDAVRGSAESVLAGSAST